MLTPSRGPVGRSVFACLGIVLWLVAPVIGAWGQQAAFATNGSQLKASSDGLWLEVAEEAILVFEPPYPLIRPESYRTFQLDEGTLDAFLGQAPLRFTPAAETEAVTILIPMPDGTYARFRVVEAPILSPELSAEHPDIKTYSGQGIDDLTATARLDHTAAGFHAMILSAHGTVYVDPERQTPVSLRDVGLASDSQEGQNERC